MTVAALVSTITYQEDGVTTAFPAPFRYKDPSTLELARLRADGTETPLIYGNDFTATAGTTDAGGTVTVPVPSSLTKLRIRRATPRSQGAEYPTNNRFPAATTENAFDTAMLIDQEQDDLIDNTRTRAILVPDDEQGVTLPPASLRAGGNKVLGPNPITGAMEILDGSAFQGSPGGNVMAVGLAIAIPNMLIPLGTDLIQTSGCVTKGKGIAQYAASADQVSPSSGYARILSGNGRYFDIVVDVLGVRPEQFGAAADCVHNRSTNVTTGTPDDQAFIDAINFCMQRGGNRAWPLYLPGSYLITQNNIFGRWTSPSIWVSGWAVYGVGMGTSTLTFRPTGTDGVTNYYLRDGLAASGTATIASALLSWQISALTIYIDASQLTTQTVNWFRQSGWSGDVAPEQGWICRAVNFSGDTGSTARIARNGSILDIVGNANCSENTFDICRSLCAHHVIACSNTQAVNHKSSFCHWEVMQGDVFRFILGGALVVTGGSIILDNTGQITFWTAGATIAVGTVRYYDGNQYVAASAGVTGSTPPVHFSGTVSDGGVNWTYVDDESFYLVAIGGTGTGQSNPITMIGVRVELRSNRAKLIRIGDGVNAEANTGSKINFYGCDMQAVTGGFRTTIRMVEGGVSANFKDCNLSATLGYQPIVVKFGAGPNSTYVLQTTNSPKVKLVDCISNGQVHNYITWAQYSTGRFTIRDTNGNPTPVGGGDLTASPDILMDCDMLNPAQQSFGTKASGGGRVKSVFLNYQSLPGGNAASVNPDGSRSAFKLPPGAFLKNIRIIKSAGSGNNVAASYAVKGVSSGTTYATLPAVASVSAGFNVSVDIGAFIPPADRELRIIDTSTNNPGSIARQFGDGILVEYI